MQDTTRKRRLTPFVVLLCLVWNAAAGLPWLFEHRHATADGLTFHHIHLHESEHADAHDLGHAIIEHDYHRHAVVHAATLGPDVVVVGPTATATPRWTEPTLAAWFGLHPEGPARPPPLQRLDPRLQHRQATVLLI